MITYGEHSTSGRNEDGNPEGSVGKYTRIGKGTTFWGNINYPSINHPNLVCNYAFGNHEGVKSFPDMGDKGPIKVGNDVWIGDNCDILSGVTIGDGAIIGLGAIVSKDIPPYAIAVGSPIVVKKYRFSPEIIEKLLRIKWWDWKHEIVLKRIDDFLDVTKFVEKYDIK